MNLTSNRKVAIDYTWGFFKFGEAIPDVLPNSSGASPAIFTFTGASDQYKHLYFEVLSHIAVSPSETYSSFLLIKCTRRNDAQDTYAGEIALLGADSHYQTNRNGSLNESTD